MSKIEKQYDLKWFWGIIDLVQGDRDELKTILNNFTREELEQFQDHFIDLSAELQDEPYTAYMEPSEDGVEEISHLIVSRGKKYYDSILSKPENAPRSAEGKHEEILYGIANEVYFFKFEEKMDRY
jgi:hypothetical protein